ncbi:MAG: FecR domain-containing protein [Lewinellaceae bacterium]|nr:FecR domain-containing protein [Lewinella sp.]MCB9281276.1 FecR domain-containing protein [Lewinellaceae bacterium]
MKESPYSRFTIDQLAADPDFQRWVTQPDPEDLLFWQDFVENHPAQLDKVRTAQRLVQIAHRLTPEPGLSPVRKQFLHDKIMSAVSKDAKRLTRRRMVWSAAAAIGALVVAGAFFLLRSGAPEDMVYRTAFGERLQVTLPDGSQVDLNANSQLRLGRDWDNGDRHVWLKGEAYFKVEKKPATGAKFTVHTDGLEIEVLGTQFNVNTRTENTQVLLEEGKVRLKASEMRSAPDVLMAPGELASFSPKTGRFSKQQLQQTQPYTSWKDGYLIYEKATIAEVIRDIQSTYGLKVNISGSLLLEKTIRGAVPTDNLDEFLEMVETLFEVDATLSGNEILLEPKKNPKPDKN